MGLGLALKAFFRALRDRTFAEQLDRLLQGQACGPLHDDGIATGRPAARRHGSTGAHAQ